MDACRLLKSLFSKEIVIALQDTVMKDEFYGVSVEATNTIGSYFDKTNYEKSDIAYQALESCLENSTGFSDLRPEIRRSIITNIGKFEKEESVHLLEGILLDDGDKSDFVKASAATAIRKSSKNAQSDMKKNKIIPVLKGLVESTCTFQNILAVGAIDGLKEFSNDDFHDIIVDISDFLTENTHNKKDYFIRVAATAALGKFLYSKSTENDLRIDEIHQKIFEQLSNLLKDKRRKIKINACSSLADECKHMPKMDKRMNAAMFVLEYVAEHDIDGYVRRQAETSLNAIRKRINELSGKPRTLDLKIREVEK